MRHLVDNTWGHLLTFDPTKWAHHQPSWGRRVEAKGAAFSNIVAFIDTKLVQICRPRPKDPPPGTTYYTLQRSVYSSHHHLHGIKVQVIGMANGLAHGFFQAVGRRHDAAVENMSGVFGQLHLMVDAAGNPYVVVGDKAYATVAHQFGMTRNPPPGGLLELVNRTLSGPRTMGIELQFNHATNTWQGVDFARWNRIFLNEPLLKFKLAPLFNNFRTCLLGHNKITKFFDSADTVPSLSQYLAGGPW
jgi:hypothetical protein